MLLGHRLALWRDRRKEFNESVAPIRRWLLELAENPSPFLAQPSKLEMDSFLCRLALHHRRSFEETLNTYQRELDAVTSQNQQTGEIELGDLFHARRQAAILLAYTQRK